MIKLFTNECHLSMGFTLLAKYSRAPIQIVNLSEKEMHILSISEMPFILSKELGLISATRQMAINISKSANLEEILCKDDKSLEVLNVLKDNDDTFISNIDKILQGSTFVSSPVITAADVLLYPRANQILRVNNKFPNACRWCLHLQSLPDLKEIIAELKIPYVEAPKVEIAKEAKKDEKVKEEKPKKKKEAKKKDNIPDFAKLDLRVGKIMKVEAQADSDKLYNEEIDIGKGEIRHISSGLRNNIPIEQMQGQNVIVFCNLKSRKLAGKESYGMVLCASNEDHTKIELLKPAEGSMPGDQVISEGIVKIAEIEDLNISKKKNPWEMVSEKLSTNENFELTYEGKLLKTDKGLIKATALKSAHIS